MNTPNKLEVLKPLTLLLGTWKGKGRGSFPTVEDFEYEDQLLFRVFDGAFESEPLIHFEERAWTIEDGTQVFKHSETGYFKPTNDGRIRFYVCHNTGRIEVFFGSCDQLDLETQSFKIAFKSETVLNDEGIKTVQSSNRVLELKNDQLTIEMSMSTEDVEESTRHLWVELERS